MTMENFPSTHDSDPLDLVPPEHTIPRGDNESLDEYSEETDTYCPFAEFSRTIPAFSGQICFREICHQTNYTYGRTDAAYR